jgi:GDP/UDP-N,N'-diacetylbacillosamine 2-epimerase (hydrolysing)
MTRRICVVTGNRADYGLLRWLMTDIAAEPGMTLLTVVTGMHLWPPSGLTVREIEGDGFSIDARIPLPLDDDSGAGVAASLGTATTGFGRTFRDLAPDLVVVLGDRYEILGAAAAAVVSRIPVAHLHGGERSEGAFDDAIRHAITKLSHLHFVAADEFRDRVIQLGEDPSRVFVVGALGLDGLTRQPLLSRGPLEASLGFSLGAHSLVVTFHPPTISGRAAAEFAELLAALERFPDVTIVMTMSNSDPGGIGLWDEARRFAARCPHVHPVASLGQLRYLSLLQFVDGVIGNSSSGLIEAPAFQTGTVNIGDRQRGRPRAASVIDCDPERGAIVEAIRRLTSAAFRASLPGVVNPYGSPGASRRIIDVLRSMTPAALLDKTFVDAARAGVGR